MLKVHLLGPWADMIDPNDFQNASKQKWKKKNGPQQIYGPPKPSQNPNVPQRRTKLFLL